MQSRNEEFPTYLSTNTLLPTYFFVIYVLIWNSSLTQNSFKHPGIFCEQAPMNLALSPLCFVQQSQPFVSKMHVINISGCQDGALHCDRSATPLGASQTSQPTCQLALYPGWSGQGPLGLNPLDLPTGPEPIRPKRSGFV